MCVADEMAGTTDAVYALLDQIWTPALDRAEGGAGRDGQRLLQKDVPGATFESWDWWYYAEKLRKQQLRTRRGDAASLFLARKRAGRHLLPRQPALRHYLPAHRRRRSTILRRSPTRCSTPTSRIWACSTSTSFRATARVRGRGAATMSNRPTEDGERVAPVVSDRLQLHPSGAQRPLTLLDARRDRRRSSTNSAMRSISCSTT